MQTAIEQKVGTNLFFLHGLCGISVVLAHSTGTHTLLLCEHLSQPSRHQRNAVTSHSTEEERKMKGNEKNQKSKLSQMSAQSKNSLLQQ